MPTMHRASAPPLEGGVSAGVPRGAVSCVSHLFASAGAWSGGKDTGNGLYGVGNCGDKVKP